MASVLVLLIDAVAQILDLPFRVVLRHAIALLDLACEVFTAAFGDSHVVVGQLAPLFPYRSSQLHPLALENVVVHGGSSIGIRPRGACRRARTDAIRASSC